MPKDNRIYITLTVDMDDSPKLAALSDAQKWLIAKALMYCRRNLTDGVISTAAWRKMAGAAARKAVESTSMCVVIPKDGGADFAATAEYFFEKTGDKLSTDCVFFPDYFEHQQSKAEAAASTEKKRSAGKKGGEAKARNAGKRPSKDVAPASGLLKHMPSKDVPELELEEVLRTSTNPPVVPPEGDTAAARPALEVIQGEGQNADGKPKRATRKRGTRLPDGWNPPRDAIDSMLADHPALTETIRSHHADFCDYWHAKAGREAEKVDWLATWRKWMRTEGRKLDERAARSGPRFGQPQPPNGLTPFQMKAARAEALMARPDPAILERAGIPLTPQQRANLGLDMPPAPAIDEHGFAYDAVLPIPGVPDQAPKAEPTMFDMLALEA